MYESNDFISQINCFIFYILLFRGFTSIDIQDVSAIFAFFTACSENAVELKFHSTVVTRVVAD